jgi:hypothetical protein
VYPRYHDTETFNERMDAAGVAGIPEHEANDSTCEVSITVSENERNLARRNNGDDIGPWEIWGASGTLPTMANKHHG